MTSPRLDLHMSREVDILPNKPKVQSTSPAGQLLAVDLDACDAGVEVDGLDPEPVLAGAFLEPDLG